MSAPAAPTTRPSPDVLDVPADGELSLAELLDLLALERPGEAPVPGRRPAGGYLTGLRGLVREWVRRAAGWGAGPQGAWRAW